MKAPFGRFLGHILNSEHCLVRQFCLWNRIFLGLMSNPSELLLWQKSQDLARIRKEWMGVCVHIWWTWTFRYLPLASDSADFTFSSVSHSIHYLVNSVSWAPHEYGQMLACGSSDGSISIIAMKGTLSTFQHLLNLLMRYLCAHFFVFLLFFYCFLNFFSQKMASGKQHTNSTRIRSVWMRCRGRQQCCRRHRSSRRPMRPPIPRPCRPRWSAWYLAAVTIWYVQRSYKETTFHMHI